MEKDEVFIEPLLLNTAKFIWDQIKEKQIMFLINEI